MTSCTVGTFESLYSVRVGTSSKISSIELARGSGQLVVSLHLLLRVVADSSRS